MRVFPPKSRDWPARGGGAHPLPAPQQLPSPTEPLSAIYLSRQFGRRGRNSASVQLGRRSVGVGGAGLREGGGDEGGCCRVCGLQDLSPPHGEVEKQQKSFFCLSVSSTTCRVLLTLVGRDASVVETATHESGAHGGWRRQGGVQAIRRDFWLARKGTCQSRARLMEPMMPVRTGTAGSADAFLRFDPVE